MSLDELEQLEIRLLLEGIEAVYGYDFRDYADASLRRRLTHWLGESSFSSFSAAQSALLRDRSVFESLLGGITVNVTEMFRDPRFFLAVREKVVPFLKTYPFVRIWHAGCANGMEAYSMAILLDEEGMAGRYRIYATDVNEAVLAEAREGIVPITEMQRYTTNYQQSGGRFEFSRYYTARYERALLAPELRESIVFAPHNLASDADFGEMNMILCRNVMIYFKASLKERCLRLFDSSLLPGGFLSLGLKECLDESFAAGRYVEIPPLRLYRKAYA